MGRAENFFKQNGPGQANNFYPLPIPLKVRSIEMWHRIRHLFYLFIPITDFDVETHFCKL